MTKNSCVFIDIFYGLILFLVGGITLFFVLHYLNLSSYDTAGHMLSASNLRNFGLHHYNFQSFTGGITNLFYPPLEDFFAGFCMRLFGHIIGYKIYLVGLTSLYLFSVYRIGKIFTSRQARIIYLLCFVSYFFIDKSNLRFIQGGFIDFVYVGLTSQILSIGFFTAFD